MWKLLKYKLTFLFQATEQTFPLLSSWRLGMPGENIYGSSILPSRLKIRTSCPPPIAIRLGLKGLTSIEVIGVSKISSYVLIKPVSIPLESLFMIVFASKI